MGITPVNPEQACPLQEHFFSAEIALLVSLIAATWTITVLTKTFGVTWLPSVRQKLCKLGVYPPHYLWRIATTFSTVQKQLAGKLTLQSSELLTFCCHNPTLFLTEWDYKGRKYNYFFSNFRSFYHYGWISPTITSKFEMSCSLFSCRCAGLTLLKKGHEIAIERVIIFFSNLYKLLLAKNRIYPQIYLKMEYIWNIYLYGIYNYTDYI